MKRRIYFGPIMIVLSKPVMTTDRQPPRKRGPPATGKGLLVGVRLQPPQLKALDVWIERQPAKMSRPEAVRKILANALDGPPPGGGGSSD